MYPGADTISVLPRCGQEQRTCLAGIRKRTNGGTTFMDLLMPS